MKRRPTPLEKQADAVFAIFDEHGNPIPVPVPTTSGQKHAARFQQKTTN